MANENINLKKIALSHNDIENWYPKTMINDVSAAQRAIYDKLFTVSNPKDEPEETPEEEYIWVEGYKGTDKDMKCRGYQYELGKKFDMPEDAKIDLCRSGFHLCPDLKRVFTYYGAGLGNRFFKVMALVPKSQTEIKVERFGGMTYEIKPDKYAAKSIVFLSECTPDEILNAAYDKSEIEGLTDEEKREALVTSLGEVKKRKVTAELVALGYSEDIAKIAFENDREYLARALAKQTNISWDTRILALITSNLDD